VTVGRAESSLRVPNRGAPDIVASDPPAPPETTPTVIKSESASVSAGRETVATTIRQPAATGAMMFPRLARISSDCDLESDPLLKPGGVARHEPQDMREEFERCYPDGPPPSSRRTRQLSHHGFFRRQILSGAEVFVPLDPDATEGDVVVDNGSASIYDVYLLRVDIARNVNAFHRHQVCLC